jgi:uncharacterized Zn-binding protein involved in type VI secretion
MLNGTHGDLLLTCMLNASALKVLFQGMPVAALGKDSLQCKRLPETAAGGRAADKGTKRSLVWCCLLVS